MGSPLDRTHFSDWEHEGELVAPDLDSCACALVLGPDAVASAEAALGIARVQARRRRVAVGDVVGELAPIESLLTSESPYGMMDSFLYGVSIAKIAHPVDPARNLFVLPSGVRPIDHEAILRSDRWSSLIAGFRDAGALLLVIVPAGEEAVVALAPLVDGAVILADADPPAGTRVLAHIRSGAAAEPVAPVVPEMSPSPVALAPADHTAVSPAALPGAAFHTEPAAAAEPVVARAPELPPAESATGDLAGVSAAAAPTAASTALRRLLESTRLDEDATTETDDEDVLGDHLGDAAPTGDALNGDEVSSAAGRIPRVKPVWVAIAAVVIAAVAILTWTVQHKRAPAPGIAQDSAAPAAAPAAPAGAATTAAVAAGDIANPGDENEAARYAVAMAQVYTITDANAWLERDKVRDLPATTYTDKPDGARTAYLVLTGAFISRADADSLLRSLRRSGVLKPGQGHIENAPVALMLFGDIPADQAGYTIRGYRSKGIPLYALYQPNGKVSLYVGAYPTAQSAQDMLAALRRGGDQPRVVYRIGSVR